MSSFLVSHLLNESLTNGGCTYRFDKSDNGRYVVGGIYEVKVPISLDTSLESVVDLFVRYALTQLLDVDGIGTWVHEGVLYLDLIQTVDDLDEAIRLAKESNELAIFDSVDGVVIDL